MLSIDTMHKQIASLFPGLMGVKLVEM